MVQLAGDTHKVLSVLYHFREIAVVKYFMFIDIFSLKIDFFYFTCYSLGVRVIVSRTMRAGPPASTTLAFLLRLRPVSGFSCWSILEDADALSKPDVTLCGSWVPPSPHPTVQLPTMGNGAELCRKDISICALKTSLSRSPSDAPDVIPTAVRFMEISPQMSPLIEICVDITSLLGGR